jgi:hypothetical protein
MNLSELLLFFFSFFFFFGLVSRLINGPALLLHCDQECRRDWHTSSFLGKKRKNSPVVNLIWKI